MAGSEDTSWRVKEKDWKNNENYDKCFSQFDTMLVQTDTANAPWTIVEAMDKKFAADKILTTIVNRLEQAVEMNQKKEIRKRILKVRIQMHTCKTVC